jgi:hypothetical protein
MALNVPFHDLQTFLLVEVGAHHEGLHSVVKVEMRRWVARSLRLRFEHA